MCNIQISTCGYPHQDVDIYMDILRDIHVQHLDIYIWIWNIYMPSIIPQPLATDPLHGRAKLAAIYVKVFAIDDANLSSIPAGGENMGLGAPPAPVPRRRRATGRPHRGLSPLVLSFRV